MVDVFCIRLAGAHWGVQDGSYFYPYTSQHEAMRRGISQARQADCLGRFAKAVMERGDGTTTVIWQSLDLKDSAG